MRVCVCRLSVLSRVIRQCWIRSFSKVKISLQVFASASQSDVAMKVDNSCTGTGLNTVWFVQWNQHDTVSLHT